MDKKSALARRSDLLHPQSQDKDDLKQIREMDESISDTKSDRNAKGVQENNAYQEYEKQVYYGSPNNNSSNNSSDPYNLIDKSETLNQSNSASKSGPSGGKASFLYRDPRQTSRMRLEKKNTQNRIKSEIKPILKLFQKEICDELDNNFPYLTSVIHQLTII